MDDNATNRMILTRTLSGWGAETTEVDGGQKCLTELLRAKESGEPYRLILLDFNMPDMDGYDVTKEVREHRELGDTPIIILTSSAGHGPLSSKVKELGLSGYLHKPFKQSELSRMVNSVINKVEIDEPKKDEQTETPLIDRALNLLLVEDNRDNRNLILAYLKRRSDNIDIAENGQIAVEKFTSGQYDLVLMDLEMPVMDGLTATREIREWEKKNNVKPTPIIALTAHALSEHREKSIEAGCTGHVTKPIKKATLIKTLAEHVA
ncbi:MAG: response regulator [Nitrospinota bacterium]